MKKDVTARQGLARLTPPISKNNYAQGEATALMTLVEYWDFECPYYNQAYPVVEIQKWLGNYLHFIFRHFPLTQAHPYAYEADEAVETADARGTPTDSWALDTLLEAIDQTGVS